MPPKLVQTLALVTPGDVGGKAMENNSVTVYV